MTTQLPLHPGLRSQPSPPARNAISPSRLLARKHIGEALKAGARTRKEINAYSPFAASKGYEYECWRSEVSTWIGGAGCIKSQEMLEQSAVGILHAAGQRLVFGVGAVELLREVIRRER